MFKKKKKDVIIPNFWLVVLILEFYIPLVVHFSYKHFTYIYVYTDKLTAIKLHFSLFLTPSYDLRKTYEQLIWWFLSF